MSAPHVRPPSPAAKVAIKAAAKLEKEFTKAAKRESAEVKHALKDVQATEKLKAKTQKAAAKAEETIEKITKIETATLKSLNKATHQHDAAVVELRNAERDAEFKRQADEKVTAELEAKKAHAAEVLQAQLAHNEERQNRIRQLREHPAYAVDGIPGYRTGVETPESRLSGESEPSAQ